MSKKETVNVQGTEITLLTHRQDDYISLTDMAKYKNAEMTGLVISHWLRTGYTINFMGAWERLHNPDFNVTEFGNIKMESTDNSFMLTSKQWVARTNAIGIIAKPGRYGGTYANRDIAFEFATWLSPEFKLYLITEFQRLKEDEQQRLSLEWNLQRTLSKINYRIHTDAIKEQIIPKEISRAQAAEVYASEADFLFGFVLFGQYREPLLCKRSRYFILVDLLYQLVKFGHAPFVGGKLFLLSFCRFGLLYLRIGAELFNKLRFVLPNVQADLSDCFQHQFPQGFYGNVVAVIFNCVNYLVGYRKRSKDFTHSPESFST